MNSSITISLGSLSSKSFIKILTAYRDIQKIMIKEMYIEAQDTDVVAE